MTKDFLIKLRNALFLLITIVFGYLFIIIIINFPNIPLVELFLSIMYLLIIIYSIIVGFADKKWKYKKDLIIALGILFFILIYIFLSYHVTPIRQKFNIDFDYRNNHQIDAVEILLDFDHKCKSYNTGTIIFDVFNKDEKYSYLIMDIPPYVYNCRMQILYNNSNSILYDDICLSPISNDEFKRVIIFNGTSLEKRNYKILINFSFVNSVTPKLDIINILPQKSDIFYKISFNSDEFECENPCMSSYEFTSYFKIEDLYPLNPECQKFISNTLVVSSLSTLKFEASNVTKAVASINVKNKSFEIYKNILSVVLIGIIIFILEESLKYFRKGRIQNITEYHCQKCNKKHKLKATRYYQHKKYKK